MAQSLMDFFAGTKLTQLMTSEAIIASRVFTAADAAAFAALTGDRNPIHLSNLTAKALGMPGAIAHGMYAAGKMLAGRETLAPYTWAIEFASPMRLPARVALNYRQDGDRMVVTGWNAKRQKLLEEI